MVTGKSTGKKGLKVTWLSIFRNRQVRRGGCTRQLDSMTSIVAVNKNKRETGNEKRRRDTEIFESRSYQ